MFNTIEKAINLYAYNKRKSEQESGTFIIRKNITPTRINTIKSVRVELFYRYKGKDITKNIVCVRVIETINAHLVNDEDLYKLVEVSFLKECFNFISGELFDRVLNGENI